MGMAVGGQAREHELRSSVKEGSHCQTAVFMEEALAFPPDLWASSLHGQTQENAGDTVHRMSASWGREQGASGQSNLENSLENDQHKW